VAYKAIVKLEVFDSEGEMIKKLLDEEKEAGTYEIEFSSCELCEGVYIYKLQAGDFLSTKKMLKVKTFEVSIFQTKSNL
jgi:hypothetical protein